MSRTLFKYTKAEYIDSILRDGGMLKLSNPSSFNDPYDCYFGVSEDNLKRSFRMITNVAFICEFKDDLAHSSNKSFKTAYELTRKSVYISHVYKENPAINVIIEKYLKTKKTLAAYFETYKKQFDETYLSIVENIRSKSLIASLATNSFDKLMWSHYANDHKGICVEYEFDDEKGLLDVIYSDEINNFDLYTVLQYIIPAQYFNVKPTNEMDPQCMNACYTPFLRKTKEWSYEKEVRMVFGISESPKLVNYDGIWFYPNVKVRSIFIGCKMDKQKREEIERKCRERGIPVHHLSVKKGANKLFVED